MIEKYTKIYAWTILILIIITIAWACAPVEPTPPKNVQVDVSYTMGVKRVVDEEAGVVCYVWKDGWGSGISCLDIDNTDLPK